MDGSPNENNGESNLSCYEYTFEKFEYIVTHFVFKCSTYECIVITTLNNEVSLTEQSVISTFIKPTFTKIHYDKKSFNGHFICIKKVT